MEKLLRKWKQGRLCGSFGILLAVAVVFSMMLFEGAAVSASETAETGGLNFGEDTDIARGDLDMDGYHWEGSSGSYQLTLKNITISGTIVLPDAAVTIETVEDCSVHNLEISGTPEKTKLTFSGGGALTIQERIQIFGGDNNTITIAKGAKVHVNGGISMGSSGCVNSVITVYGDLAVNGIGDTAAIDAGMVIVDSGILNVSGADGVRLNGMNLGGIKDFDSVFTVKNSGCFTADCSAFNVRVESGGGQFYEGNHENTAVNLPPGYLPDDCKVQVNEEKGIVDFVRISTGEVYTGPITIHENHDWSGNWQKDDTGHWKVCKYEGCGRKAEEAKHNFMNDMRKCTCGAELAVTLGGTEGLVYDGQEKKPDVTVTVDNQTLDTEYYNIEYRENLNAGEASVSVRGKNDLVFEQAKTFEIGKAMPVIAWNAAAQELDYTGSEAVIAKPTVTLVNNEIYSGTIQYSYAAQGSNKFRDGLPVDVGTYTVRARIAEQSNYTAAESDTMTLTINCSHNHTEIRGQKKATCTEKGYSGDTCCKDCGTLIKSGTETDLLAHTGGRQNCISGKICEVCGQEYTEKDSAVHDHTEMRGQKKATCTEKGYSGDTCCKDCGTLIKRGTETALLEHTGGRQNCISGKICEVCGQEYTEKDSTVHDHTEIRGQKKATCTAKGKTGDTYCKDCNTKIQSGKKIPALGHKWHITSENEKRIYRCARCGAVREEEIQKPSQSEDTHSHSYKERVLENAACTKEGKAVYTCSCGASYTRSIPALKHEYTPVVTTEPTIYAEGVMTYICSRCGHQYTERIPMLEGHEHVYSATVLQEATRTKDGIRMYVCTCGDVYTERIPMLSDTYIKPVDGAESALPGADSHPESENLSIREETDAESSENAVREEIEIETDVSAAISEKSSESIETDHAENRSQARRQFPWWILLIIVLLIITGVYVAERQRNKSEED